MPSPSPAAGREWLLQLASRGPVRVQEAASSPATVAETIAHLGEGPLCWGVEVGREMARTIIAEIPAFGGGEGPFQMLRKGTESSALRAMLLLAYPDLGLQPITEEALEGDREFVRRGITLDTVLRGIRFGHAGMAQAFLSACEAHVGTDRVADEMKSVSEELFRYIDGFADAMVVEFLAERDRWITSAAAARAEAVSRILDGEDVDVPATSELLGYDLSRRHLALVAWADAGNLTTDLERAAQAQLRASGAAAVLVVPVGGSVLWAWGAVAGEQPSDPVPEPADPRIRTAHGLPGCGPAGFRQSHVQAVRAHRLARLAGPRAARSTGYADVSVLAMLTEDLDTAREFVARELGPLAAPTEQADALRETLLRYLDQERSVTAVAADMHVARGTVVYRVRRAEELLGRDVGTRRLELHTALLLAQRLGAAVLPQGG